MDETTEKTKVFVLGGNGGLVHPDEAEIRAAKLEPKALERRLADLYKNEEKRPGVRVDIQGPAFQQALDIAHGLRTSVDKVLVGMGVLLDVPRGFREIDAFEAKERERAEGDPDKLTHKRLKEGPLPNLSQLKVPFKDPYLDAINAFNVANRAEIHLDEVLVCTDWRARREMGKMARGQGACDLRPLDKAVTHGIFEMVDSDKGEVVQVRCPGVYAGAYGLFHKLSNCDEIQEVWVVDDDRVRLEDLVRGAEFATNHLGVPRIVETKLGGVTSVYTKGGVAVTRGFVAPASSNSGPHGK